MGRDRMAGRFHLAHHRRVGDRHAPDHEERALGAVRFESLEHHARVTTQWTVVERQDHFTVAEQV